MERSKSCFGLVVLAMVAVVAAAGSEYEYDEPLNFAYYHESCPQLEKIIHNTLHRWLKNDSTLAPALMRLHFHDCVVRVRKSKKMIDSHFYVFVWVIKIQNELNNIYLILINWFSHVIIFSLSFLNQLINSNKITWCKTPTYIWMSVIEILESSTPLICGNIKLVIFFPVRALIGLTWSYRNSHTVLEFAVSESKFWYAKIT